ncbi:hypothetical protein CKAH01_11438 [Colletotrichum kahawae]|uniref:Uncharacterized protein n=1 Tax=Colletotrichum kahawae TaxID=34407 RepID=A0AAE0DDT1_COLKA|nr:hypothetical protein CKAH01_11438 [Colletotrichum kahawae]
MGPPFAQTRSREHGFAGSFPDRPRCCVRGFHRRFRSPGFQEPPVGLACWTFKQQSPEAARRIRVCLRPAAQQAIKRSSVHSPPKLPTPSPPTKGSAQPATSGRLLVLLMLLCSQKDGRLVLGSLPPLLGSSASIVASGRSLVVYFSTPALRHRNGERALGMWEGAAARYERLSSLVTKELSLFSPLDAVKGTQHGDVMRTGHEPPGKIANFEGQRPRVPSGSGKFFPGRRREAVCWTHLSERAPSG